MGKIITYGQLKAGKIDILNPNQYRQDVSKHKDCLVKITIEEKGTRSIELNSYYWPAVVQPIRVRLNELGNDLDDDMTHEFLKLHFNPVYIYDQNGEVLEKRPGSTKIMNNSHFLDYVAKIRIFASEKLGIYIYEPNEQKKMEF
jgi:hypothetical protein